MWYVYLVRCSDNTLYCGSTNNVGKRVETHNSGKGAKYTKARLPVKLVYQQESESKSTAMSLEYKIKQLTKSKKEILVSDYLQ